MIDARTQKPIHVFDDGSGGPYMIVTVNQLAHIRQLLDSNKIKYWVDSNSISIDHKPFVTFVNFGHNGDAGRVQAVLDGAE